MNKSMRKLFGKVVIEVERGSIPVWPGIMYVYGSERSRDGGERVMVVRGGRTFKRHSEVVWGLPIVAVASSYRLAKPTEQQCRNFIRNTFNAFK